MRAKFFRFQFVMEVLYKLRNFGVQNYRENGKQKFQNQIPYQKFKIKFQHQISYQKSKINLKKNLEFPKTYFQKNIKKRAVFYRYRYI
ncbi:hypothetical protein P4V48_29680 [Bacillus thuringiensis]|nr:hypothetical protein [Bacillus thuringiensis]